MPSKRLKRIKRQSKIKSARFSSRKEPSAYNNLGQAYLYAEEYTPAIENFKKVIEMAPNIAEGYVNLTTAYLRQNLAAERA